MNHQLLESVIKDKGVKKYVIADKIGISRAAFYAKLAGATEFSNSEIQAIKVTLNLSNEDFMRIFFDDEVDKKPTEEDL